MALLGTGDFPRSSRKRRVVAGLGPGRALDEPPTSRGESEGVAARGASHALGDPPNSLRARRWRMPRVGILPQNVRQSARWRLGRATTPSTPSKHGSEGRTGLPTWSQPDATMTTRVLPAGARRAGSVRASWRTQTRSLAISSNWGSLANLQRLCVSRQEKAAADVL